MLERIIIENVAVIEHADVVFDRGLNILTGETGAGKSIIIDSINLVLGMRSNREIIRTGAQNACVTAVFSSLGGVLPEGDITPDEDGKLIIERSIGSDGRGNAKINGKIVSVTQLRQLGETLAGIYGQHESGALLDPDSHLGFLDAYADDGILLEAYKEDYSKLRVLAERIRALKTESRDKERRLELLKYQIKEIDDAALERGEEESLLLLKKRIQNSERIIEALSTASGAISDEGGAADALLSASQALTGAEPFKDDIRPLRERIDSAAIEISECLSQIHAMLGETGIGDADPAQIDARIDVIYRLKSKYGATYDDIMRYRDDAAREINEYENRDGLIESLTGEYKQLRGELQIYADELTQSRKKAASDLCGRVQSELAFLNMKSAVFYADVKPAGALTPSGQDTIEFMLSANAGELPRPLARTASGGELSRIMLAIKNALNERDGVPTQVFDEIDSGVSGRAAIRIGIKLKEISNKTQVLCVTHLAQIAAYADRHLLIEKSERTGRTYTEVIPLDFEARTNELARIMSGDAATDTTRISAKELLDFAKSGSLPAE